MSEGTPIQTALDAEKKARDAVEQARERAREIRQEARDRARRIDQRAQERIQKLHDRIDHSLTASRKSIEERGSDALTKLHHDAIDDHVMTETIDSLVQRIMEGGQ